MIERFSEDVDLSLSRRDLGFADDHDPEQSDISKKEIERRINSLALACRENIRDHPLPNLRDDFGGVIGTINWNLELDSSDPQTIVFTYPPAGVVGETENYIHPAIRLELGARSDDWPAADHEIRPYAAEAFPTAFAVSPSCCVHTLEAERTFWEKATLLHAEYHRPKKESSRERLARHYYDVYQLSRTDIAAKALGQMNLLDRVVKHKMIFFRAAWAHYETAKPGSFHLVPSNERMSELRSDYAQMKTMIFGDYPDWQKIISGLKDIEKKINNV